MKHPIALILTLFLSFQYGAVSQSLVCGTRLYPAGPTATDSSIREFVKVRTLPDGNIIHAGQADEGADANFSLTKTLPNGDIIWQKAIGTTGLDVLKNFIVTQNGGFVMVGWSLNPGADYADALIVRLNANGDVEWSKQFGGTDDDEAFGATELSNGDILITGTTFSFGPLLKNAFALRLSPEGNEVWCKAFAKGLYNYFLDAIELSPTEVVLCGYTWVTTGGTIFDPMFVKVDADGNTIWTRWIKMDNSQIVYDFEKDVDGGIVFGGVSTIPNQGQNQNFISKINAAGNHQWTKLFGTPNSDRVWDLAVLPTGGYVAAGFAGKNTSDTGPRNGFIARLSNSGVVEASLLVGTGDTVTTTFTGISVSGDFLVANGFSYKNGHSTGAGISVRMPHSDFSQTCASTPVAMPGSILTGVDSAGIQSTTASSTLQDASMEAIDNNLIVEELCTFTQVSERESEQRTLFFPNPGKGLFHCKPTRENCVFSVYSSDGKMVATGPVSSEFLDLRQIPDGFYLIKLENKGEISYSERFIKQAD